jgi:Ca-activated chloride channel family protein
MTFEWPQALLGLALLPILALLYLFAQRRRRAYALRFTNLDLLREVVGRAPGIRRHVPPLFFLLGLAALLVALARPQTVIALPREQATVLMVVDVSGSMNATDVQPSRLVAAKQAANTFLDELPPTIRVGVVSFAGSAQVLTPPTDDRAMVRRVIGSLRADGGTAMGDGIARALEVGDARSGEQGSGAHAPASEETPPAAIVLLSDGASSAGRVEPAEAADEARAAGVPIFTIALGTPNGTVEQRGPGPTVRRVGVPPDEATLREIADVTGGRFFAAPTAEDLRAIYENLASRVGFIEDHQEVTFLFAAAGAALVLTCGLLSLVWFNRLP